ncbi:Hypothetical predicted protein, partial [Pelobates cultripes]
FRKSLTTLTSSLRTKDISYCWGYPAKLLIVRQGAIHSVMTIEDSLQKLRDWGIPLPKLQPAIPAKIPRMMPVWTQY